MSLKTVMCQCYSFIALFIDLYFAKHSVREALTAKSIQATAQSAVNKAGWVYDRGTKTYFDYSTNLYYYPVRFLLITIH